jgi:hypothetical protein
MSAPGIELRWGQGFEQKPRKRERVRPYIRQAIDLAEEGLYEIGLQPSDRKYIVIDQAGPNEKWRGQAKGKTCHINLTPNEAKSAKIDTVWLAAFVFHELVHLVHEEYVPGNGMLEHASSEGLANVAQYNFVNGLLYQRGRKGPPHRVVEKIRAMPKRDANRLELEFWKASARPDSWSDENIEEWFGRFRPPVNFPKGATVGILAVSKQLKQGWDIAELVTLPPDQVLDAA